MCLQRMRFFYKCIWNLCITQIPKTHSKFFKWLPCRNCPKVCRSLSTSDDIGEAHCSESHDCLRPYECSAEYAPEELKEEEIERQLGHLLLKLESIYNVPSKCVIELVAELQVLSSVVSGPAIQQMVNSCLRKHNCVLDNLVVSDLVKLLSESNPISTALRADGPLVQLSKDGSSLRSRFM